MFFPSALPWEILADIVAPSQKSKALWSQNIAAVALTCMSAVPASRLWGPDKAAPSQLRLPHLLHK